MAEGCTSAIYPTHVPVQLVKYKLDKKIVGILVAATVLMLTSAFSSAPVYAASTNTCTSIATYGGSFYTCTVALEYGWNLISSPVVPFSGTLGLTTYSNTVNGLFGTTTSGQLQYVTSVYTYSNSRAAWSYCLVVETVRTPSTSDTWSCVAYGGLTTLIGGNGYWVYANNAAISGITIGGYVIPPASAPPSYALRTGWNLLGFEPAMTTTPVTSEAFATYTTSITSDFTTAYAYCNTSGQACTPLGGYESSPPTTLYVGQAFWVYMTSAETFYPG